MTTTRFCILICVQIYLELWYLFKIDGKTQSAEEFRKFLLAFKLSHLNRVNDMKSPTARENFK